MPLSKGQTPHAVSRQGQGRATPLKRRPGTGSYSHRVKSFLLPPVVALLLMAAAVTAQAQSCVNLAADHSVPDGAGCLALVPASDTPGPQRVVVALLHGDSRGVLEARHIERWNSVGRNLAAPGRAVVLLVRPGYRSPAGDSSGWANPRDDDYTVANVDRIAQALRALRVRHGAERVVMVGHSGGAALAALVLGRHPDAADGALLLGCPCDVPPWREHRNRQRQTSGTWANSLNPLDAVAGLRPGAQVQVITGERDDNTLPEFGRRWAGAAAARGLPVAFESVRGRDHGGTLSWPLLPQRLDELLQSLASRGDGAHRP